MQRGSWADTGAEIGDSYTDSIGRGIDMRLNYLCGLIRRHVRGLVPRTCVWACGAIVGTRKGKRTDKMHRTVLTCGLARGWT